MVLDKLSTEILCEHDEVVRKKPNLKSYKGKVVTIDASARLLNCKQGPSESFSYMMYYLMQIIPELESGVKPIYVFSGSGPSGKIKDRKDVRKIVKEKLKLAKEDENTKAVYMFRKQLTRYNSQHVKDIKRLLWLLGIPYIDAPGEAEAQCASIVRLGHAFATVSQDVVSLVYGSNVLLRDMKYKYSKTKKAKHMFVQEIHLDKLLKSFNLTHEEFIDFTLLVGCDYIYPIKYMGPRRALKLIREYHNIESCMEIINREYAVPEEWNYKEARERYARPLVRDISLSDLEWREPDHHGILDYLCRYYRFDEEQVRKALEKI